MQKQTFSAKALGNEYATGVSRPAALTTKAFLPHQRVTTEGKGMDEKEEFPSGFSNLMYALTKEAARNSFLDFLEEWGIEDYDEIKAFLAKNGVKTYC
ncbi:TPA: hypothetical protein ACG0EZ_002624 [Enterobacter ludwigii]|uniref:hypothetical protein n=2 Tax=Enterobacter TaxID=547 RepID=UPI00372DEFBE